MTAVLLLVVGQALLFFGTVVWLNLALRRARLELAARRATIEQLASRCDQQTRDLAAVIRQRDQAQQELHARTRDLLRATTELAHWRQLGKAFVIVDGHPYSLN